MTEATLSICKLGMRLNEAVDGQIVANLIDYVERLDVIDMRGNTLGINAAEVIAQSMRKVTTLRRAIFSDMFTGRLKSEIPQVLKKLSDAIIEGNNRLLELDLSDNALGPSAIPGIEEFLSSTPCYTLCELRFNNCGLGSAGITVANRIILCQQNAERAGYKFELREFCAGRNRLENAGAEAMSAAFKKLGTLVKIELPQNGINAKGIIQLAKGIGQNQELEHLNLNDNTFTTPGATAMSRAIRNIQDCLRVVDFGDCLCRDGAVDVIEAISDNHKNTIQRIDLTGNELTPDHARTIIELCVNFPHLQMLTLGYNSYGSAFASIQKLIDKLDASTYIDLGEEEDDNGSASEKDESDDEGSD